MLKLTRRDVLCLTAGLCLATVGRVLWPVVWAPAPAAALDLAAVDTADRLWAAFADFLEREDEQLRVFAPEAGAQLAHYRGQTAFFGRFLVAGEGVVWHEDLRSLTAAERIERVCGQLERDSAGLGSDKAAALQADLRQVLAERAAALEVLRFSTPGYAQGLLGPGVAVSWGARWEAIGSRESLRGTVDDLYRRRASELLAQTQ
jgi:hypothetical protein